MHQRVVAVQWFLTVLTGLGCGALALIVSLGTRALTMSKLRLFHAIIENEKSGSAFNGAAFMFLLMANQLLASLAWGVVYLEPVAGGSGIPEVKCYLNGLDIPRV
jgi:chloride channel 7